MRDEWVEAVLLFVMVTLVLVVVAMVAYGIATGFTDTTTVTVISR